MAPTIDDGLESGQWGSGVEPSENANINFVSEKVIWLSDLLFVLTQTTTLVTNILLIYNNSQ